MGVGAALWGCIVSIVVLSFDLAVKQLNGKYGYLLR